MSSPLFFHTNIVFIQSTWSVFLLPTSSLQSTCPYHVYLNPQTQLPVEILPTPQVLLPFIPPFPTSRISLSFLWILTLSWVPSYLSIPIVPNLLLTHDRRTILLIQLNKWVNNEWMHLKPFKLWISIKWFRKSHLLYKIKTTRTSIKDIRLQLI